MRSHGAVASKELGKEVVTAVWADWRTAPVSERLRVMLGYLEKMSSRPEQLSAEDLAPLRAEGLSHEEIAEAMAVSIATVKRDWTAARAWLRRELESG